MGRDLFCSLYLEKIRFLSLEQTLLNVVQRGINDARALALRRPGVKRPVVRLECERRVWVEVLGEIATDTELRGNV